MENDLPQWKLYVRLLSLALIISGALIPLIAMFQEVGKTDAKVTAEIEALTQEFQTELNRTQQTRADELAPEATPITQEETQKLDELENRVSDLVITRTEAGQIPAGTLTLQDQWFPLTLIGTGFAAFLVTLIKTEDSFENRNLNR